MRADVRAGPGLVTIDVADEASVDAVFAEHGPFDGLVCSAGIRTRGMIVDTPIEEWERHLRVNLTGTWLCIRAFLRGVPAGDRHATGDRHDRFGQRVDRRSRSGPLRRLEGRRRRPHPRRRARGRRARRAACNAIAPGPIRTPMAAERLDDPAQLAWLTSRVPLGRIGEPSEIGAIAAFLFSDAASYVTGEVLYADGTGVPGRHTHRSERTVTRSFETR